MEPFEVSNSSLSTIARCDAEYVLRYIHRYDSTEEQAATKSGSAGHEALAAYFRGLSREAALDVFDQQYKAWAEANVEDDKGRFTHANMRRVVELWLESHPIDSLPYKVPDSQFVEINFKQPLTPEGDIVLKGIMDLAIVDTDGDLVPLDHKFTGRVDLGWVKGFRNDSQMSGYIWTAGQHFGKQLLKGYVNAIQASKLPTSDRKCKDHGVPYSECQFKHAVSKLILINRVPDQLEDWRQSAVYLARRMLKLRDKFSRIEDIHQVKTQGAFLRACSSCAFSQFCGTGRSVQYVDSILKKREERHDSAVQAKEEATA